MIISLLLMGLYKELICKKGQKGPDPLFELRRKSRFLVRIYTHVYGKSEFDSVIVSIQIVVQRVVYIEWNS